MSRQALWVVLALPALLLVSCDSPSTDEQTSVIDLESVDACSLLDESDLQAITGETSGFSGGPGGGVAGCFWGTTEAGAEGYVELSLSYRSDLDGYEFSNDSCTVSPLEGVGSDALGVTCPADPQKKVYVIAVDKGVLATLLVNAPETPLTPADLAEQANAIFAAL